MPTPSRILPLLVILGLWRAEAPAAEKVDFNYDIRPLISSKCYQCHGPDEKARKAKLRLDMRDDAIKEHESGRTIVPGDPLASELMKRITTKDPDEVMPPPKEEHALTPKEVDLFRRWIAEGAEYKVHWSFVKPVRPALPAAAPGAVVRNPIDRFITVRLAAAGLRQSPEADRYALIRRASLDLTGLPPTPEETEAFVHDAAPDAYEKLVDRLLASPAYGERWAKMWLDLARYADSTGYGSDKFRLNIWPYRDWVINAFNRNEPYDQFTIDQLAGDLLPNPTPDQISATAFHRNTLTNVEGGTIDEEYRVAAVKDRISTTGEVWMGLTVGCAQCHTHKFDPITQKDYYRFFGIFNQTEDSDREDEEPKVPRPTAEELAKQQAIKDEIAALEEKIKNGTPEAVTEQRAWEAQAGKAIPWQTLAPVEMKAASGAVLEAQADGSVAVRGPAPENDTYTVKIKTELGRLTALRLEALPEAGPGAKGTVAISEVRAGVVPAEARPPRGRFVRVMMPGERKLLALAEVEVFSKGANIALGGTATQSSTAYGGEAKRAIDGKTEGDYFKGQSVSHTDSQKDPWWEVDLGAEMEIDRLAVWNRTDSGTGSRLAGFQISILDAARQPVWEQIVATAPAPSVVLNPAEGQPVALKNASADFSEANGDVAQALDGKANTAWVVPAPAGEEHAAVFEVASPITAKSGLLLLTIEQQAGQKRTLKRFRISVTTAAQPVREIPRAARAILAIAPEARTSQQEAELGANFRSISKTFAGLESQVAAKRKELGAMKLTALPIMRELAGESRRETHILTKGNYLAPGEKVEPGLLGEFSSFVPPDTKMDRLAAARWLMNPENPLTARVAVNRFWSQLFGTGIVETEEDFGSQGALPSNPALLDWMAVTFMSPKSEDAAQPGLGWDVKALLRMLVTSATYRQSSKVTPEMLEKDARNRLLAHAPRRRLDAEAVRDQALALSGLLSHKLGGPSVYPPQPDGLWKVAFNGGQNAYPTSKGEDRYRRGIYTFWRRTMPYPSMVTFDAPSRESCTLRRLPTNTPLQAFVTMNDPVFVECSQALARRIVREGGADAASRIRYGLRISLGRPPSDEQVKTLEKMYEDERVASAGDAAAALKLATQPLGPLPAGADAADMAAWTVAANVLLNLDAVLTKN